MKISVLSSTVKVFGAVAFALSMSHSAFAESEPVRWKVPIAFPSGLPALGDNIHYVAKAVDQASNGDIKWKVFEPGKLVPSLGIVGAVRENKIPAGYTWLGYNQGQIPSVALISAAPFGMEPWEYMGWWYEGEGESLTTEVFDAQNIKPILCGITSPETAGWFSFEINSLEDIKGLKIRFAGLGGKVLQKLGASVTVLPAGEIFQALEKGAIDATEFSLPVVDEKLGFYKIAKYNYFPGWHQTYAALHLVVNKDVWAGLGSDQQALIEMACTAGVSRNLARSEALQGVAVQKFQEELGVTSRRLSDDILRELERLTNEVLDEEAENDDNFAKILASQRAYMKVSKYWKSLGYLPRDF